jgi:hypothetical protein
MSCKDYLVVSKIMRNFEEKKKKKKKKLNFFFFFF